MSLTGFEAGLNSNLLGIEGKALPGQRPLLGTVSIGEVSFTAQTLAGFEYGYVVLNNGALGLNAQPRPEQ